MHDVMDTILDAKSCTDIERIIMNLGDTLTWCPLANDLQNYPRIAMSSDPYGGITERITNAMDAMIELEAEQNSEIKKTNTPRFAVEQIYKFNGGNLRNADEELIGVLSSNIKVKFLDSENRKRPTIEVIDRGIGQHPSDFPDTLVNLNSTYKYKKFYLIGAFGQGGQTSFANCPYGIIISRKYPGLLKEGQNDVIGWTIVRYRDPSTKDEIFKYGLWEYCIDSRTGKIPQVFSKDLRIAFDHGTLIRLISYDLPKGTSDVLQPAGTAWGFLSESLFDPLLPIRLYECRERYENRNRTLSGLGPRLWGGGKGSKVQISMNNSYKIDMENHGSININYWTLKPAPNLEGKETWRDIKKGFVSGSNAIFITQNGQTQGMETIAFLRDDVDLKYSYEYLIVQIDCDGLTNLAKKELFSSTRENLRKSEMKDILMEVLTRHLRSDRNILSFERERKKEILTAKTHRDTSNIKKIVGKMIFRNSELSMLFLKSGKDDIEGKKQQKEIHDDEKNQTEEEIKDEELEIPDLKPIPTYLKITNIRDPIPIEKGGFALIRLETDAEDSYLDNGFEEKFRCIHQSNISKQKSCSKLRDGKISYYVHCPSTTRIGTKERLHFELDLPDKSHLWAERDVICRTPIKRRKVKKETKLPEPNIKAITKEDELWNKRGYNEKGVGEIYLDSSGGKDSAIIVSLENIHLQNTLKKHKIKESLIEDIKDRYVAAIAYYLLLREIDRRKRGAEECKSELEEPDSNELQRLALTVSLLALPTEAL